MCQEIPEVERIPEVKKVYSLADEGSNADCENSSVQWEMALANAVA